MRETPIMLSTLGRMGKREGRMEGRWTDGGREEARERKGGGERKD